jgi:hypothetical protein
MKQTMSPAVVTWAAVLVMVAAAGGDVVEVKRIPYEGVTVTGIDANGQLTFRKDNNVIAKEMKDVTRIRIDGLDAFNTAESRLGEGKAAEAVASYDEAQKQANLKPGLQQVILLRRLQVLKQLKASDRAVEDWLRLVDELKVSPSALALRPEKEEMGAKGSAANRRAISVLEAKLGEVKDKKEFVAGIQNALIRLYEVEGNAEKAAQMARELAGTPGASGRNGDTVAAPAAGSLAERAEAIRGLIDKKQATVQDLQGVLKNYADTRDRYNARDLSTAMLLAGRAQLALYDMAPADRNDPKLLQEAGLNLMRVFAHYADAKEAPEALFYAGKVNLALGNRAAARQAMDTTVHMLEKDTKNELLAKAKAEIEEMKKLKTGP